MRNSTHTQVGVSHFVGNMQPFDRLRVMFCVSACAAAVPPPIPSCVSSPWVVACEREWDLPMRGVARADSAHLPGVVPPPLARGICGQMWHHGGSCSLVDRFFLATRCNQFRPPRPKVPAPVLQKSDFERSFLKSETHDCSRRKIEHRALRSDEQDFSFFFDLQQPRRRVPLESKYKTTRLEFYFQRADLLHKSRITILLGSDEIKNIIFEEKYNCLWNRVKS